MKLLTPKFETEAALCQAFLRGMPPEWLPYPETAGWDILFGASCGRLADRCRGKATLNAKVICQAINGHKRDQGPRFQGGLGRQGGCRKCGNC